MSDVCLRFDASPPQLKIKLAWKEKKWGAAGTEMWDYLNKSYSGRAVKRSCYQSRDESLSFAPDSCWSQSPISSIRNGYLAILVGNSKVARHICLLYAVGYRIWYALNTQARWAFRFGWMFDFSQSSSARQMMCIIETCRKNSVFFFFREVFEGPRTKCLVASH